MAVSQPKWTPMVSAAGSSESWVKRNAGVHKMWAAFWDFYCESWRRRQRQRSGRRGRRGILL